MSILFVVEGEVFMLYLYYFVRVDVGGIYFFSDGFVLGLSY